MGETELDRALQSVVAIGVLDGPHKEARLQRGLARVLEAALLTERAAVVAWLREKREALRALGDGMEEAQDYASARAYRAKAEAILTAADAIERGAHVKGEVGDG